MPWYDDTMRTIIELPEDQIARLREYCAHERVSRAEAVRRAVEGLLANDRKQARQRAIDESFGSWKDLKVDSVEYVRRLREEWER